MPMVKDQPHCTAMKGAAHERAPTTVSSRRMDIPITGVPNALAATYARAGNREEALKIGRQAREQAAARGQTQLLRSIDRDLQALEVEAPR